MASEVENGGSQNISEAGHSAEQSGAAKCTGMAPPPKMSANAEFLFTAVFRGQPTAEVARRFFPTLRQWAETKKAYRGRTFSPAEVEEVISACECQFAGAQNKRAIESCDMAKKDSVAPTLRHASDCCWPRWVLDTTRGVEVLAPTERGKAPAWVPAQPVGIGYHGQKRRYLFVRANKFEMDCRRSEVRAPGGGRTVEEQAQELLARGDDPASHPDWTDGAELAPTAPGPEAVGVAPGLPPSGGAPTEPEVDAALSRPGESALLQELEGDFERMALLRRSALVRSRTCDHPDPLAEPSTAASIRLPALTSADIVALPRRAAEERLSSLQLETVCFAARRFRTSLPDGRAAGYVLGDGTGCGKGRCISAMICHLWNLGCRRSVWVSATSDLYYDACRDLQDLGADIPCMPMRRLPPSGPLDQKGSEANRELVRHLGVEGNGVIFLTYSLLVQTGQRRSVIAAPVRTEESRRLLLGGLLDERLRCVRHAPEFGAGEGGPSVDLRAGDRVVGVASLKELQQLQVPFTVSFERVLQRSKDADAGGRDAGAELTAFNSRLGQLVAWLGGGQARGLICFDEVHKAKNLVPDKDDHASTKTGLFVELLQQHCPRAPVLYVSATAATEVQHLGYMGRLGAWGPGTAFESFRDFSKTIEASGVAAMEMFAINMKAVGAMSCRSLAYVGTEFSTQQCGLTRAQREMYDEACRFWQGCLLDFRRFVDSKELREAYRSRFFARMRRSKAQDAEGREEIGKRLWQFFWGAQQRFFKAMCNALKVPAACAAAQEAAARGEQVLLSIWATGEARSRCRMAHLKDETPGRAVVESVSEGGLVTVEVRDAGALEGLAQLVKSDLRLRSDVHLGGQRVQRLSRLQEVQGRRAVRPGDLLSAQLPVRLLFRAPTTRRLAVEARLVASDERVRFELGDDALGERVVVAKVLEGPPSFLRAEQEGWHVKTINDRPVGKVQVRHLRTRLRKGVPVAFQDAVIPEHLSGPQMILEQFLTSSLLTHGEDGQELEWAREAKGRLLEAARGLTLPANAMDEILDTLGGAKRVAEMSGRSHRMKRRKDGSLAYVARCEELRCTHDGANLVEQVLFQKGAKKFCIVTEVASAGISLHADRRQVRKDFQPPRRTMISVELPWGADKAIQCFGRVHRANQLVPPRFIMLCTPLGGEVRFISAIARRMKLLGAVTKGDRMTSMGGSADRHMSDFDVNNAYGVRALEALYLDTTRTQGAAPDLLALYEGLSFVGAEGEGEATGRWPRWEAFAAEVASVWGRLNLKEELNVMIEKAQQDRGRGGAMLRESESINRFFNRLLMLEVDLQNAIFEAFFAIYTELVRIDQANGAYDDGIETLNRSQGRWIQHIEVNQREVLYTDPVSGAETHYVRLCLDRGVPWEAARGAYEALPRAGGSAEGFYAFRAQPGAEPLYLLVKEREQVGGAGSSGTTWVARRRRKQYVVWRADSGAPAGAEAALHAFSAEDFSDERYERLGDTDEALAEVEAGWQRLYEASRQSRLSHEHLLTGDVLGAWRLAAPPARSGGAEQPQLKIVRAITQPGGVPIVGMRVTDAELPQLRYVLGCQHQSALDGASALGERPSIRDICVRASGALLARLGKAEDGRLPLASWLQVHKMLAAEGAVPRSADGLRGVQQAVERLAKRGLVAVGEGAMALRGPAAEVPAELLEAKLFPEEFVADGDAGSGGESSDESCGDALSEFDPENLGAEPDGEADPEAGVGLGDEAPAKRKCEAPGAASTPAKGRRAKCADASGASKSKAARRRPRKDHSKKTDGESAEAMWQELFGPDLSDEGGEGLHEGRAAEGAAGAPATAEASSGVSVAAADCKRGSADSPGAPARKRRRKMARALFGSEAASPGDEGLQGDAGSWTYEVTGNKLGIRRSPAVDAPGIGYLATGEFFNVSEQLKRQDGRTYLKLADGRGWVYDRSAKDVDKVVVRLIQSK